MPSKDTQFKKGNIPWNKGLKGWQKNKPKNLFKKGHLPWNTHPIGTEKNDKDGYVRVKVNNEFGSRRKNWKLKQHVIYEKHHPNIKIGKTDRIIFLDGNKRNFDINNLELITLREQVSLIKFGKLSDPEETRALLQLIKLRHKLLDMGADKKYNYKQEYIKKHPEKVKEYARNSNKKLREKRKQAKKIKEIKNGKVE